MLYLDDDDEYVPPVGIPCPACKQTFLSEMMVKYHDCPEKKEEDLKCDECGKSYWSEKMLNIHKKTHIKYDDDMDDDILNMVIPMPTLAKKVAIETNDEDGLVS